LNLETGPATKVRGKDFLELSWTQVVEHLFSKCEALSLIPSITHTKKIFKDSQERCPPHAKGGEYSSLKTKGHRRM
jgi:hypothetical protein